MKKGSRVGAILGIKDGVADFIGFGVYLGDQIPETDDVKYIGVSLKEKSLKNPCILLDNGKKVYGCECWLRAENGIKEILNGCNKVNVVDIDEIRKSYNNPEESPVNKKSGDVMEYTDTDLIEFLERYNNRKLYTGKCVFRLSVNGRGWRLHETLARGASNTVREAIIKAIETEKRIEGQISD